MGVFEIKANVLIEVSYPFFASLPAESAVIKLTEGTTEKIQFYKNVKTTTLISQTTVEEQKKLFRHSSVKTITEAEYQYFVQNGVLTAPAEVQP